MQQLGEGDKHLSSSTLAPCSKVEELGDMPMSGKHSASVLTMRQRCAVLPSRPRPVSRVCLPLPHSGWALNSEVLA